MGYSYKNNHNYYDDEEEDEDDDDDNDIDERATSISLFTSITVFTRAK